jgi:hypothetical protein
MSNLPKKFHLAMIKNTAKFAVASPLVTKYFPQESTPVRS